MGDATNDSILSSDHSSLVCENSPPDSDHPFLESGHCSHKSKHHSHDFEHFLPESKLSPPISKHRHGIYPPVFGLLYALVFIYALYLEFSTSRGPKPSDLTAIYVCLVLPAVAIEWALVDERCSVLSVPSVFVSWMIMCLNVYVCYLGSKLDRGEIGCVDRDSVPHVVG